MEGTSALIEMIRGHKARIGIVGLGYVGLPVAVSFAQRGFSVVGVDLREEKVDSIARGHSHLRDVPDERLAPLIADGSLRTTVSFDALKEVDAVIIAVPTPVAKGAPDLSRVVFAGEALAHVLKPGSLFVLESTTYPGTTEELLRPLLEAGGLVAGEDFLLAYSPERIDPGNPVYGFEEIPKVVGGIDQDSTDAAAALYEQVVPNVVRVSGTREAEMAKLIENTFRHVNIALVNELALYSRELGVDIWESIRVAGTKPFGYMPFYPSPGWGGHCIPIDPTYLSWKVRSHRDHEIRFIELAQAINSEMPRHVVERCALILNDVGKPFKGSKILGIGLAYKGGTEDTRESSGIKILGEFERRGASVAYCDPLVEEVEIGSKILAHRPLTQRLVEDQDLVVIFVKQDGVDWQLLLDAKVPVFDCCNALGKKDERITRL